MSSYRSLQVFLRHIGTTAAVLCAMAMAPAGAATVSGNFNDQGYDTLHFELAGDSTVDLQFLSGYDDPVFSLFDSTGAHLITSDDVDGYLPRLTLQLGIGTYDLIISACCAATDLLDPSADYVTSDGTNIGSFYRGGSTTLTSMQAGFIGKSFEGDSSYALSFSVTPDGVDAVPEPATLALVGLALGAAGLARRRATATA